LPLGVAGPTAGFISLGGFPVVLVGFIIAKPTYDRLLHRARKVGKDADNTSRVKILHTAAGEPFVICPLCGGTTKCTDLGLCSISWIPLAVKCPRCDGRMVIVP
jgi:hypothetical protein